MKKIIMAFLLSTGVAIGAAAQDKEKQDIPKKDVPEVVQTSLKNSYSSARDIEWKQKDGKYIAEFEIDGKDHFAGFDANGTLVKKGMEITREELPSAVISTIQTAYAADKIDDVYKVEEDGQIKYKVELDGNPDKKLMFSADGKLLEEKAKEAAKNK